MLNNMYKLKFKNKIARKVICSAEKSEKYLKMLNSNEKLPDNVYYTINREGYIEQFIEYVDKADKEQINEYISNSIMNDVKSIKNSLKYFVILSIVTIALTIITTIMTIFQINLLF